MRMIIAAACLHSVLGHVQELKAFEAAAFTLVEQSAIVSVLNIYGTNLEDVAIFQTLSRYRLLAF